MFIAVLFVTAAQNETKHPVVLDSAIGRSDHRVFTQPFCAAVKHNDVDHV